MDLLLIELVPLAKNLAAHPLPLTDTVFLDTNPTATTDLDEDSERENMYFRLEPLGFRVGHGIAERSLSYLW
jgi:trafficking protein particle complex subunit 6